MVYNEGLQFVDSINDEQLGEVAANYMTKERRVHELEKLIEKADLGEDGKLIRKLLKTSGARAWTELEQEDKGLKL